MYGGWWIVRVSTDSLLCALSESIAIASLKDDWREVEVSSLPGV